MEAQGTRLQTDTCESIDVTSPGLDEPLHIKNLRVQELRCHPSYRSMWVGCMCCHCSVPENCQAKIR